MVARIKSAGLIAAFLVIFFPFPMLADNINFSVIPAEVHIDDLLPGEVAEFELTIHNKEEIAHNFTITTFPPPKEERREGRAQLPDDTWIGFSSPRIEIAANSQANVTVTTAVPREQKWAGRDWEIWLGVTPESSDLLAAKLYVRLLVSTGGMRFSAGLVTAIAVAIVLLAYGGYHYFRRKTRSE
jgi:hypothetical protein